GCAAADRGGSQSLSRSALPRRICARFAARVHPLTMRVGVVGTGYLGRLHARILSEMPEADVVGFVETNDAVAAEVSQSLGLRRLDSVAALARQAECAVVATPTTTHFQVARQLIEAGLDVLIEKPITPTVEEGERLVGFAASKDRVVQVGHVERYNPAITAI